MVRALSFMQGVLGVISRYVGYEWLTWWISCRMGRVYLLEAKSLYVPYT